MLRCRSRKFWKGRSRKFCKVGVGYFTSDSATLPTKITKAGDSCRDTFHLVRAEHPRHRHLPPWNGPSKNSVGPRLNPLHTGVGRFRYCCLHKWDITPSGSCKCGAEEQTVDHVVLQCPIHRPPHGLHGLTVLHDETIQWLLNTCLEIQCGQAVDSNNWLKRRRRRVGQHLRSWSLFSSFCWNSYNRVFPRG